MFRANEVFLVDPSSAAMILGVTRWPISDYVRALTRFSRQTDSQPQPT